MLIKIYFSLKASFIFGLSLAVFLFSSTLIKANEPPQVLIINQVRGTECCEVGSVSTFRQQLELLTQIHLPAFFMLRWDVLNNTEFIRVIQENQNHLFSWGIFLEITPGLAEAAGVSYEGDETSWYQAQHAYTLGYSLEERTQLIDTIMAKYHDIFGEYPSLTTSWIIDTPTLNYLHEEYGVVVHQITREQWGTDSYTIYGGPPHYPYPASKNWAIIPDYSLENPVLIVRQTLTDPVWNYGDTQSRFTSQPNDFTQDGKDFDYFVKLFDQAMFSQAADQTGFALLGLENSMEDQYQQLFQQQLELVADYQRQNKISLPDLDTLRNSWLNKRNTFYQGQDLVKENNFKAIWITGETYRLRLFKKDQQVCIDDVRLYDAQIQDYYTSHQAQDMSYWITPFLLDGSRFFTQDKGLFAKKITANGTNPLPDVITQSECWSLPQASMAIDDFKITQSSTNSWKITYETKSGPTKLVFQPTHFVLPSEAETPELSWLVDQEVAYQLDQKCEEQSCAYYPQINSVVFAQAQEMQTSSFLPEQRTGEPSIIHSQLYADNPYAVAGRNPVRVVFIPRDEQNVAVKLESKPQIETTVKLKTDSALVINDEAQFYDFISEVPTKDKIVFSVEDDLELTTTIFFAPNCKADLGYCLHHPRQGWWYLRSWLGDKHRFLKEKIYKFVTY